MESLTQDIRYGFRMLLKQPGFTAVAVIALALGVGANTAIFSMVNAVLLRQLPYKQPMDLVWVWSTGIEGEQSPFSIPDFIDYRDQNRTLEQMAAYAQHSVNLTESGEPERFQGIRVSANGLQVLGVNAASGRTLLPEDDEPGKHRVVMLSYDVWQRRFGGNQSAIGNSLVLNGDRYIVIGVLPPEFVFPGIKTDMVFPISLDSDPRRSNRTAAFLRVIARLKPGVTPEQAQSDLSGIAQRLQQQYPGTNERATGVSLISLQDAIVGNYGMALLVLLAAVGLVLLIACTNLANLLLARASSRHKEVAIRLALGATKVRLVRQLLTESVVLALLGGALGLALAKWGTNLLVSLSPANFPRATEIDIDGKVLAFTLILSVLAGIIFGLAPALQAPNVNLNQELTATARGSSGGGHQNRVRNLLVVFEIAISLMLLIAAGLLIKSFTKIQAVNSGFQARNLLVVRLALPKARYSERATVTTFYEQLSQRVGNLPGVDSFSAISILPLSGLTANIDFTVVGQPPLTGKEMPVAQYRMIGPNYFRTMSIPILEGREFADHDTSKAPAVVIINEALAQRFWPGKTPIGEHLEIDDGDPQPRKVEIVGVVGDVKHYGLDEEPTTDVYVPIQQLPEDTVVYLANNMFLVCRTKSDPMSLAGPVRREVQSIDRDVPASNASTMEQYLSASLAPRRFNVLLLELFAGAALVLAGMGLYSVISFGVTCRTREIGIRMALGAQQRDVLAMVVKQGLKLIVVGVVVGLMGALAFTRVISSLLFSVSSTDLVIFAGTSLLLICIGLIASYIPARKATKVNPITALRIE